jgi:photosystem II stability/assembly factor-like uncharacterized protein
MNQFKFIQKLFTLGVLIISLLLIYPNNALAHRPHDVIDTIAISPSYEQDKTIFIVVRGMLMRSTDGGQHWQRITGGLDNQGDPNYVAISSQKASTLYLSTPLDGIYKSEDTGTSWRKVNEGIDDLHIKRLTISPQSSDIVLAAARDHKLYYTENGGKNWQSVLSIPGGITALDFSPTNPSHLIAGDNEGNLYFSQTSGKQWQSIPNKMGGQVIRALAFAPDNTWFIGTNVKGILKSSDQGLTLEAINKGITDKNIEDIIVSPNFQNDSTVMASTWDDGTFISTDKGKTWQKSTQGLTKDAQADTPAYSVPHFTYLRATNSFSGDKTLYLAGFNGLFKSTDGGQNWRELYTLSIRAVTALGISPNYAQDGSLAIGTYEGEAYLTEDRGKSWKSITNGLTVVKYGVNFEDVVLDKPRLMTFDPRFFDLQFSPGYSSDKTLFAALIYQFTKSTNKGNYWHPVNLDQRTGWRDIFIAASPAITKDKTVYLGAKYGGEIYRSKDNGNRFTRVGSVAPGENIASLEISPNFAEDNTLYVTTLAGVHKSVDGGATWTSLVNNISLGDKKIAWRNLAISPGYKTDQTVIVGTNYGVYKSTDAGKTWTHLAKNDQEQYLSDAIAISPDYVKDQTFIVSARGLGLIRTTDGGKTFVEIGKDLNQQGHPWRGMVMSTSTPILFSPNYATDKTLYGFGTNDTEVYKSTDSGNTWEIITIDKQYNLGSDLSVKSKLAKKLIQMNPVVKFSIASLIALLTYFWIGNLHLEKLIPLNRYQIRLFASILVSLGALVALSILAES